MNKPDGCSICPLVTIGQGFTRPEGKPELGVALYGETSGMHEIQESLPMRPNSEDGSLLTTLIQTNLKLKRSAFVWDTAIKCMPPMAFDGGDYEKVVTGCCNQYSHRGIGLSGVRVIMALGPVAFRSLTGIQGHKLSIADIRGYVFKVGNKLVVPTYAPSFIRKGNPRLTGALLHDLKKAIGVASGAFTSYDSHAGYIAPTWVTSGKLDALVSLYYKLRDNPNITVFYDIETPWSANVDEDEKGDADEENETSTTGEDQSFVIKSIQFAIGRTWAITVPWIKPFIKVAGAILALANEKVAFNNWHFDDPRLRANDVSFGGKLHDCMWAWHHVQPGLDKGLQKVASFFGFPYHWKYTAGDAAMEDMYGGSDVIALAYIWDKLPTQMRAVGVWNSYLKYKVRYREVLRRTEQRGVFVDDGDRLAFAGELKDEIGQEDGNLQSLIPFELLNAKPRRKDKITGLVDFGYKKIPKVVLQIEADYLRRAERLAISHPGKAMIPFDSYVTRLTGMVVRDGRWCKLEPFKASVQQLVKYLKFMKEMYPSKGYYVPLALKTKKQTTGKKDLIEVYERTDDDFLKSVIKIRSLKTMLGNYIPNWTPASDGCVHTSFKFDPPSWQLNSSDPNIQNARKHEPDAISKELKLGQRFRRIIRAPPGRCVVEFDKRSYHVTMMGFEARDPLYLKWSKVDMHTLVTSYIVQDPIPLDGEPDLDKIKYIKKKFKNIRDTQGKPTVLGNQLGLGASKLYWMNKTYVDDEGVRQIGIESKRRAEWLQALIAHMFPVTDRYKGKIAQEAYYKGRLLSSYGCVRWFFDVLRWDYKANKMRHGSEYEEAVSHNVQADAFGMIHSEILEMGETTEILEEHWFANTIHDSCIFFPEYSKLERCIAEVSKYMQAPALELVDDICCPDGLVVDIDIMASPEGGNWATYKKGWNDMGMQEIH